ncbi:MAG TPA: DUF5615 family PIN-like protein [Rhizomicrobium sp.]|nr:DUF5615 family PIN-like protein [Rhizomicrobium sp.]
MRFLLDAQLSPRLAAALTRAGHQADHLFALGHASAPDATIWRLAQELGAAILTKDSDFAAMRMREDAGPAVIWLRLGNCTNAELERTLMRHLPEIVAAVEAGEVLIEIV